LRELLGSAGEPARPVAALSRRPETREAFAAPWQPSVVPSNPEAGDIVFHPGCSWRIPNCCHFHPRVQDEMSQSFDFLIFKHGNQIQTGRSKGELVRLTR
jgi:hypothetical protein